MPLVPKSDTLEKFLWAILQNRVILFRFYLINWKKIHYIFLVLYITCIYSSEAGFQHNIFWRIK